MKYYAPELIVNPKDYVKNVEVIFNGGEKSFSLVKLDWNGSPQLAIRRNVSERESEDQEKIDGKKICAGMPSSHGYPVWFVLPQAIFDKNTKVGKALFKALK